MHGSARSLTSPRSSMVGRPTAERTASWRSAIPSCRGGVSRTIKRSDKQESTLCSLSVQAWQCAATVSQHKRALRCGHKCWQVG